MLPSQTSLDSEREMRRRNLSPSQINRRNVVSQKTDEQFLQSNKFGERILNFGKASFVAREDNGITVRIHNTDLNDMVMSDLYRILEVAKGPLPNVFKDGHQTKSSTKPAGHKMLHFGIWMNNVKHYSGGRVSILLNAYVLASMGHKVTIVTDMKPPYIADLKHIDVEDRVEYIADEDCVRTNWLLKNKENNIDIVIATPRIYEAFSYAEKFHLPCYAMLFETPNYTMKFRGGQDATEEYWKEYKHCIMQYCDGILCHPGTTMQYCKEWLIGFTGKFNDFSPPINTFAADKVEAEEQNEIVFIGRMLEYKNPDDVVKAIGFIEEEIRPTINFIGSHNEAFRNRIRDKARVAGVNVKFYAGINDCEKYYLIKRAKMLVIPTKFEGFGMPPAEALYCKKPVVCYDIPITRSIYGDYVNYVPTGDIKKLGRTIGKLLLNPEERVKQGEAGYKAMFNLDSNIPCLPSKIKNNARKIFYGGSFPTITAGIIVLNGEDTLDICLKSIYDSVEQIIVVEGAINEYAHNNPHLVSNGHSVDTTLNVIKTFNDPLNKIVLVTAETVGKKIWKDKNEMQNEIAKRVKTDLYMKVDADEIWKESDIEFCRRIFLYDPKLVVMHVKFWNFWKDLKTVAIGGQWESIVPRMWRWNNSFRHPEEKRGFNYFVDKDGEPIKEPKYKSIKILQRMFYHLGYCRSNIHILGKIKYYANRGIEINVRDNYSDWKPGQPTSCTHPDGTTAAEFNGTLPKCLTEKHEIITVNPKEVVENNITMMNAK